MGIGADVVVHARHDGQQSLQRRSLELLEPAGVVPVAEDGRQMKPGESGDVLGRVPRLVGDLSEQFGFDLHDPKAYLPLVGVQ